MTVPVQIPINRSLGNGVTNAFPYNFLLLDEDDLVVHLDDAIADASTYTVSGVGSPSGGMVTFNSAPGAGVIVSRVREMLLQRLVDYQNAGDFKADTVDADFDRIWMVLQDISAKYSRSIHVGVDDDTPFDHLELPPRSARSGLFLAFGGDGAIALASGTGGADAALRVDLATASMGDILIAVQRSLANAAPTNLHRFIEALAINVVADFGVDNTGVTDATVNINKALQVGGDYFFPDGEYTVSASLYTKSNSRIVFSKGAVLKPTTIDDFTLLKLNGRDWGYAIFVNENWQSATVVDHNIEYYGVNCFPDAAFNGHVILSRKVSNVKYHWGDATDCADFNATLACTHVLAENNYTERMSNCAYDFWEGNSYVVARNNVAVACNAGLNWNAADTYLEQNLAANHFQFLNNRIFGGPGAGIFISPLNAGSTISDGLVQGNYVNQSLSAGGVGNVPQGIVVQRSVGVTIEQNTLDKIGANLFPIIVTIDGFAGVSDSCIIRNNKIINSVIGGGAMIGAYGTNHTVSGNTAYNSTADIGIVADSPTTAIINQTLLGATTQIANQTTTGTPTTPATAMQAEPANGRFRFWSDIRTEGIVSQSNAYALAAQGINLGSALAITARYNHFSTVASGTGAVLPQAAALMLGKPITVWNAGANALKLYARAGDTIDGATSQNIAAGAKMVVVCMSTNIWLIEST